jgi:hypothetical protein
MKKSVDISLNKLQSKTRSYESLTRKVYPTEKENVFEIKLTMQKILQNEVSIFLIVSFSLLLVFTNYFYSENEKERKWLVNLNLFELFSKFSFNLSSKSNYTP